MVSAARGLLERGELRFRADGNAARAVQGGIPPLRVKEELLRVLVRPEREDVQHLGLRDLPDALQGPFIGRQPEMVAQERIGPLLADPAREIVLPRGFVRDLRRSAAQEVDAIVDVLQPVVHHVEKVQAPHRFGDRSGAAEDPGGAVLEGPALFHQIPNQRHRVFRGQAVSNAHDVRALFCNRGGQPLHAHRRAQIERFISFFLREFQKVNRSGHMHAISQRTADHKTFAHCILPSTRRLPRDHCIHQTANS